MKGTVDVHQGFPTVISDSGKIRIGSLSPTFPPVRGGPANISDGGNVKMGAYSPAFPPPVRGAAATGDEERRGEAEPAGKQCARRIAHPRADFRGSRRCQQVRDGLLTKRQPLGE